MRVTVTDDEGVVLRSFKVRAATPTQALKDARDLDLIGMEEFDVDGEG